MIPLPSSTKLSLKILSTPIVIIWPSASLPIFRYLCNV
nr:MAG TPA: hypothetical protein [Caudoviricetes sp.]